MWFLIGCTVGIVDVIFPIDVGIFWRNLFQQLKIYEREREDTLQVKGGIQGRKVQPKFLFFFCLNNSKQIRRCKIGDSFRIPSSRVSKADGVCINGWRVCVCVLHFYFIFLFLPSGWPKMNWMKYGNCADCPPSLRCPKILFVVVCARLLYI